MSSNIIINKRSIKGTMNSMFEYALPKRLEVKATDNYKIALSHLNVYLSWANITAQYNNNKIIYTFWDINGDLQPFEITIPDGFYELTDVYSWIQKKMYENGHYLENLAGDIMYFFTIRTNSTYYSHEFFFFSIGTAYEDKTAWKTPTTWTYPTYFECMSITFPTYGTINEYFGFETGTITPSNVANGTKQVQYSILSQMAPQLMPSSSYLVLCNLVNNELSEEKRVLTSFTIPNNLFYGDVINIDANPIYTDIASGLYDQVRVEIVDQDYRRMQIIDPEILINLSITKN
jgi:hypothetical protein